MALMLRRPKRPASGFGHNCPNHKCADRGPGTGPSVLSDRELTVTKMPGSPLLHVGILALLHFLWAVVAGIASVILGFYIASLIGGAVPVPRPYLSAGGITTLALAAAWFGPRVVERFTNACVTSGCPLWALVDYRHVRPTDTET
jgi:hypothetical protein